MAIACVLLLFSTFMAFRPVLDKKVEFLNFDDNRYVYENEHVMQGLTRGSIAWAFTSLEYDNWHPLTWLSHMADRTIFGPESPQHPWGCHLTNIVIHAVNGIVLFLALCRMTAAVWPSLLVAVLFSVHPLRTESVAWISERKDVLSGLFFVLTLWAYAAYASRARSWTRYCLVIVLFAVGLLAKPILVTLPVLLLLLDYWPLKRIAPGRTESGARECDRTALSSLLWEKVPLVALAAGSSIVTLVAQQGAMKVIDTITLPMRLENALVSYATYIGEIFYPAHLAPLYPFPEHGIPGSRMAISVVALATITALVVHLRDWPWLTVGWLWYLVAVTPVIGLVQVGVQAMADRYTYLPHIGLYIMLAWSLEAVRAFLRFPRWVWAAALAILTPVLVVATADQTAIWTDNKTFWTAALQANPQIALAENNLGYINEHDEGNFDLAFQRYQHAVEIRPRYVEAHINLGNGYMHKGEAAAAAQHPSEAKQYFDQAMQHYRTAIEIRPDFDLGYVNLGTALMLTGDLPQAEMMLRNGLQANSQNVDAYGKLGAVLYQQKKYDEAIPCYTILLQLPPTATGATKMLGYLYYAKREPKKALEYWTAFLGSQPDSLPVLTMTAWLLATDPDPSVRDGNKAVALAERAVKISQGRNSRVLIALAAAYAETGDFTLAAQTVEQAGRLPDRPLKDDDLIQLQKHYQSGNRYYDGNAQVIMPCR
jgi:protein O-mannosyl-transferase